MSNSGSAIPLDQARAVGQSFIHDIGMAVTRAELAGSVRRGRDFVHDIEIVVIPRADVQARLPLGFLSATSPEQIPRGDHLERRIHEMLDQGIVTRNRPRKDTKANPLGPRYYRIGYNYQGSNYPVDLFAVKPPAQWGVVFLIRTGSAEYSHWFVQQGYGHGVRVRDGHLERNGVTIDTPEETDVFRRIFVPYADPKERDVLQEVS
ncbi:Histidinol phosphatase of the PHP family protein [Thermoplasmatales archaeon]|nr:Histidinol phosphatase of the PHP family protein [Thermoplasmatales archaeon]